MLVGERMTSNPVTIGRGLSVRQALQVMEEEHLGYLPVVDERGGLVGTVSERVLLRAEGDTPVHAVMTSQPTTVTEYTALEEAARIMADQKISVLPVLRQGRLVGILTETDLFEMFLEALGAREPGLRLTLLVPEEKGMLAKVTSEIAAMGGNIVALSTFRGEDPTNRSVTVKVTDVPKGKLLAIMEALGAEIVDVREV